MKKYEVLFNGKEKYNLTGNVNVCLLIVLFFLPNFLFANNGANTATPLSVFAPTPPTPQSHVQNFFSDAYTTPITVSSWAANSNATAQILTNSGSHYLQYTFAAGKDSIQTANFGSINIASYNYIHIDIYSPTATTFSLVFIDGDSVSHQYQVACANPTLNKWVSYDIPLSLYSSNSVDLVNLNAFLFIAGNASNAAGTALYIDNIYFSTTANYFSNGTGNLDVLSTWGTNSDGTNLGGVGNNAPSNFTSNNINYYVVNNTTATIGANWKVSGSNSKVVVGNFSNPVSLVIPSAYTFTDSCTSGFVLSASGSDVTVNVAVTPSVTGLTIPSTFNGLSWEMNSTPSTTYFALPKLVNLVKNLGTGMLRIGANSGDNMWWSHTSQGSSSATDTLFQTEVDRYFNFVSQVGWKTLFGLNLGTGTVSQATDEAQYISSNYASSLATFEIGNEPDLFHDWCRASNWGVSNYIAAFDSFYNSIHAVIPSVSISGATGCCHVPDFGLPFLTSRHSDLTMATWHYYFSQAGASNATIQDLLTADTTLASNTTTFVDSANKYSLPFRWSECNSLSGGGQAGVSNVFASALWGIDFMYTVAKLGCSGVNFHGGGAGHYTPITYTGGNVYPMPLYYGMLGFSLGSNGTFIQNSTSKTGTVNCNVYTVLGSNGKYYITIVNKDLINQAFVKITGLPTHHSTQITRLNGAYITNTTCNLGNSSPDTNGNWVNTSSECAGADASSYQVKVPKEGAVILVIN